MHKGDGYLLSNEEKKGKEAETIRARCLNVLRQTFGIQQGQMIVHFGIPTEDGNFAELGDLVAEMVFQDIGVDDDDPNETYDHYDDMTVRRNLGNAIIMVMQESFAG